MKKKLVLGSLPLIALAGFAVLSGCGDSSSSSSSTSTSATTSTTHAATTTTAGATTTTQLGGTTTTAAGATTTTGVVVTTTTSGATTTTTRASSTTTGSTTTTTIPNLNFSESDFVGKTWHLVGTYYMRNQNSCTVSATAFEYDCTQAYSATSFQMCCTKPAVMAGSCQTIPWTYSEDLAQLEDNDPCNPVVTYTQNSPTSFSYTMTTGGSLEATITMTQQ